MKNILTVLLFLIIVSYSQNLSASELNANTVENSPSTVSSNLDIHIPSLIFSDPSTTLNLWANFEYYGQGPNGELLWKLKDYGDNQPTTTENVNYTDNLTGMEFVLINSGCYQMGDTFQDGNSNEKPIHNVCLDSFYIGKYEVTNKQYKKYKLTHDSSTYSGYSLNGDNQPVVFVNHQDAKEFANWLSAQTGKSFRLPTEAEWEYVAKAGTTTRNFWGNSKDDACLYANTHDITTKNALQFVWENHNCSDGNVATAPVGSFNPNSFGVYDIMGNVWEWTEDVYSETAYSSHSANNPKYVGEGTEFVVRGGSWSSGPSNVRSAKRFKAQTQDVEFGFRLVMEK